jgi:hypothetical protein
MERPLVRFFAPWPTSGSGPKRRLASLAPPNRSDIFLPVLAVYPLFTPISHPGLVVYIVPPHSAQRRHRPPRALFCLLNAAPGLPRSWARRGVRVAGSGPDTFLPPTTLFDQSAVPRAQSIRQPRRRVARTCHRQPAGPSADRAWRPATRDLRPGRSRPPDGTPRS